MCFTIIYSIFFSYSTNKIESPCANPRYTQCLKSFSYLLTAVKERNALLRRFTMSVKKQKQLNVGVIDTPVEPLP